MSSFKRILGAIAISAACAGLAACGFQPIASTQNDEANLVVGKVAVEGAPRRFEYELRQAINRILIKDPSSDDTLTIVVDLEEDGLAIEQDDAITRFNLSARANYRLAGETGEPLASGRVVSNTALNATSSQFATEINRRDAQKRLAVDIANRVITALRVRSLKTGSL